MMSKMTTTTIGGNRAGVQSASDSVPYKFARGDFRIRLVAYLATRDADEPCFVLRVRTSYLDRKIRLEGFVHTDDVWVAHIELCKVTSRREEEQTKRSERGRERKQRASIGSVSDACREEKSTRLEITINLRGRLRHSKLICFESINKKLYVT